LIEVITISGGKTKIQGTYPWIDGSFLKILKTMKTTRKMDLI